MMGRAGLWVFGEKLFGQLASLALIMILARLLTPNDFGIVAVAQVLLSFSQVAVRFGIGAYLVHVQVLTDRIAGTAQTLMLVLAFVISALLLVMSDFVSEVLAVPELVELMPVIVGIFLISAAMNPSASLLARDMDFKFLSLIGIFSHIFGYGLVAVLLAAHGYGYWAMIIGTLVQALIRGGLLFWRAPVWPNFWPQLAELKSMLGFGSGVFVAQLMSLTALQVDNLIISSGAGTSALGFYSRAYGLMEISNKLIGSVFREVLFSGFAKKRREGGANDSQELFLTSHAVASLIITPVAILSFVFSEQLIFIIYGEGWGDAVPVLEVLSLSMFLRVAHKVSGSFLLAEGAIRSLIFRTLIYAVLVAFGAWIGLTWGLSGVAVGVSCALCCHFLLLTSVALERSGLQWRQYITCISPFLIAGMIGFLFLNFHDLFRHSHWSIAMLVDVFCFGLVYGLVLATFRSHQGVRRVEESFCGLTNLVKGRRFL